tara:strand:- start:1451 stop:2242 length:792 start_codon:yes stop_codon:yes gene_type:complete
MEQISTHEEVTPNADAQAVHEAEMVKVADELEVRNNPDAEQRPDWLPEKFKSAEQMAEAYASLESKLGSNEQTQETTEETTPEVTREAEASEVKEVLDKAGVDFNALQSEYTEQGEVSADSYAKLEEAGFSKDLVDSYIKGQESLNANYEKAVYDTAGGQDAYGELIQWAGDNLQQGEIAAFDKAVSSGDVDMVKMAVSGLQTKYQAAEGTDPTLLSEGQSSNSTGGVFNSWAEVTAAMNDTRYESDVAYRQKVSAKLGRSQL